MLARRRIDPLLRRRIDEHRMPGQIGLRGQARRAAHHRLAAFTRADAGQQRIARGPYRLAQRAALGRAAPVLHLRVHPVSGTAQRQLAQRNQVALAKKMGGRAFGLRVATGLLASIVTAVKLSAPETYLTLREGE